MFQPPPASKQSNASHLPSGDQRGEPHCSLSNRVNSVAPEPSAFATHTATRSPPRPDSNAMRRPSGEYCGLQSRVVDVRNGTGALPLTPTCQMSELSIDRVKAKLP